MKYIDNANAFGSNKPSKHNKKPLRVAIIVNDEPNESADLIVKEFGDSWVILSLKGISKIQAGLLATMLIDLTPGSGYDNVQTMSVTAEAINKATLEEAREARWIFQGLLVKHFGARPEVFRLILKKCRGECVLFEQSAGRVRLYRSASGKDLAKLLMASIENMQRNPFCHYLQHQIDGD